MKHRTITITCQDRLHLDESQHLFLDAIMESFQNLKRSLFSALHGEYRPSDLNEFKRNFCNSNAITSTQYNSLKNECDGIYKSQLELQEFYRKECEEKIKAVEAWIEHKQEVMEKSFLRLNQPKVKEEQRTRLKRKIKLTKFKLHHKKRKLAELKRKLAQLEKNCDKKSELAPRIVFGSRDLLSQRHRLKANGYKNPEEWKKDWQFARSNAVFFLGDSTELHRNREVKGTAHLLDRSGADLHITIPYKLRKIFPGKSFAIPVHLSERTQKLLKKTLDYSYLRERKKGGQIELKEARLPISYRITKRLYKRKGRTETRYYLQTMIQIPIEESIATNRGAIGVDVNVDHLAVGIVDRHGNPKRSFSIPFRPYEGSKAQNEAALGAIIHDLCDLAEKEGLPLVLEKLKLPFLMAKIKHSHGRKVNRKLSALSYNKIFTMFNSVCARRKVGLVRVFAAYSSKLGAMNYQHMRKKVSSHEAAAFVLARRGMKLKDYLDTSHINDSAPEGREILSLMQSGPAGPAILRKKKVSEKINFRWLKDQYLHFDPDECRVGEFAATRQHTFTPRRFVASCA